MKKLSLLASIFFLLTACTNSNYMGNDEISPEEQEEWESQMPSVVETEPQEAEEVSLDPLEFDLMEEYTGGALILKQNTEGLGSGNIVNLIEINSNTEEKRLGALKLAGVGKVIFDEINKKLYFMAYGDPESYEDSGIYEFDFNKKEVQKVPLELTETTESRLVDFAFTEDRIFYLEGLCFEGNNSCKLLSYNRATKESKPLLDNLESGPVSGFTLDLFKPEENKLILSLAGGDAGVVVRKAYEIDLNNPVLPEPEVYSYFTTCDEQAIPQTAAECSEEEIASTKEFIIMREEFATQICPNEMIRNKFKDDWSVMFVHCPNVLN